MDYNDSDNIQNPNETQPPQPPLSPEAPQSPPPQPEMSMMPNIPDFSGAFYEPQKKKGSGWKVFWGIVVTLSILANGVFLLAMLGMGVALAATSVDYTDGLIETVLVEGNDSQKIAVINVQGVIEADMSDWVRRQVERAEKDRNIKGLIVRIVSPGGAVSSSDQIHYYLTRFKEHTNKPVLAFMQSIAASGGYYSAVACDEIMAEPTVITGSIGVIMNHLVLKDLLEEKLGISPVTLKSGKRKDWPSMFNETTEEEKQYLMERVITPAYDRFVTLVTEGRQDVLTEAEVRELADGSIYTAQEAMDKKLIDAIGYFDDAVAMAQGMAGVSGAQVISYEEEFSLFSILGAQSKKSINLESEILEKIAAPRLLYLWDGKQ